MSLAYFWQLLNFVKSVWGGSPLLGMPWPSLRPMMPEYGLLIFVLKYSWITPVL